MTPNENNVLIATCANPAALEAATRLISERFRQSNEEGFTPEHDAKYHQVELARAAACYATPAGYRRMGEGTRGPAPLMWPWPATWWKPGDQTRAGRLRDLEKAGALILAEMERLIAKGGA